MEKIKCKSYFGDYKCHVKTNVKDSNGDFIYVDKCLKEAVENLNAVGLKTVASCCGHGIINPKITIEGLSDGGVFNTSASGLNIDIVTISEAEYCDCPQPHIITTTDGGTKCSLCGKCLFKQY